MSAGEDAHIQCFPAVIAGSRQSSEGTQSLGYTSQVVDANDLSSKCITRLAVLMCLLLELEVPLLRLSLGITESARADCEKENTHLLLQIFQ